MHKIVQYQLLLGSCRGTQHAGARKMTEKEKGMSVNIISMGHKSWRLQSNRATG